MLGATPARIGRIEHLQEQSHILDGTPRMPSNQSVELTTVLNLYNSYSTNEKLQMFHDQVIRIIVAGVTGCLPRSHGFRSGGTGRQFAHHHVAAAQQAGNHGWDIPKMGI